MYLQSIPLPIHLQHRTTAFGLFLLLLSLSISVICGCERQNCEAQFDGLTLIDSVDKVYEVDEIQQAVDTLPFSFTEDSIPTVENAVIPVGDRITRSLTFHLINGDCSAANDTIATFHADVTFRLVCSSERFCYYFVEEISRQATSHPGAVISGSVSAETISVDGNPETLLTFSSNIGGARSVVKRDSGRSLQLLVTDQSGSRLLPSGSLNDTITLSSESGTGSMVFEYAFRTEKNGKELQLTGERTSVMVAVDLFESTPRNGLLPNTPSENYVVIDDRGMRNVIGFAQLPEELK